MRHEQLVLLGWSRPRHGDFGIEAHGGHDPTQLERLLVVQLSQGLRLEVVLNTISFQDVSGRTWGYTNLSPGSATASTPLWASSTAVMVRDSRLCASSAVATASASPRFL